MPAETLEKDRLAVNQQRLTGGLDGANAHRKGIAIGLAPISLESHCRFVQEGILRRPQAGTLYDDQCPGSVPGKDQRRFLGLAIAIQPDPPAPARSRSAGR